MIKLFKYEGYRVTISEEALLLKPFKVIWQRDRSKNKDIALIELGFIYFFADPRSDYQYLTDDKERLNAIKVGEGLPDNWKPDKVIKAAIEFYESFVPTSALLLKDTKCAVNKLRILLRDINLTAKDDHEKPIYTLNTVTATIKQIPTLAKDLDEAEKSLAADMKQSGKMRGQGEKTLFEDDLD